MTHRHRLAAAVSLLFVFVASLLVFEAVWKRTPFEDIGNQPGGWLGALAIVACSAIVHELLHAVAWVMIGRARWRSIAFRPTWSVMGFAARVDAPISTRAYRIGVAVPGIVLGLLPVGLGLATGRGLFVLWALFFLLECYSDLTILFSGTKRASPARMANNDDDIDYTAEGATPPHEKDDPTNDGYDEAAHSGPGRYGVKEGEGGVFGTSGGGTYGAGFEVEERPVVDKTGGTRNAKE